MCTGRAHAPMQYLSALSHRQAGHQRRGRHRHQVGRAGPDAAARGGGLVPCGGHRAPSIHREQRLPGLAFTRYSFTSSRLCTSQSSFHSSGPPALSTLLKYYRVKGSPCTHLVFQLVIGSHCAPPIHREQRLLGPSFSSGFLFLYIHI